MSFNYTPYPAPQAAVRVLRPVVPNNMREANMRSDMQYLQAMAHQLFAMGMETPQDFDVIVTSGAISVPPQPHTPVQTRQFARPPVPIVPMAFPMTQSQGQAQQSQNTNNNQGFDEHNYFVADDIPQRGLSNDVIAAIPIRIVRGRAKTELCAICHENFESERFQKQLVCGHGFHAHCIGEWLSRNTRCPTCRDVVKTPRHN
jgi:hypothetical protein